MTIALHMDPRQDPMTWDEFRAKMPPYSIAIDGFVADGPQYDESGPWLNLNHHEKVDRLATRATVGQALMARRMGLYERFCDEDGRPNAIICANDCDEDVCSTVTALSLPERSVLAIAPKLNRLAGVTDLMDTTAGAYPFDPTLPALKELAWIFEPYRKFRSSGRINKRVPEEFTRIVHRVRWRIVEHLHGRGKTLRLDTRYERLGGGKNWTMFRELGENGRVGAFADGIRAYVIVRDMEDGSKSYTVGRVSQFIPFPVPAILAAMTVAEKDPTRIWGGGNTIGGSNRARGSGLTPAEVGRIINDIIK